MPIKKAASSKEVKNKSTKTKTTTKKTDLKKKTPVKATAPKKAAKTPPKTKKASPATAKGGMPEQLLKAALKVLDLRKAEEIVSFDLRGKSAMADYVIVATGGSNRQLAALAQYIKDEFAKLGVKRLVTEGLPQGDWVLIDAGDILIHLLRPEVRHYYRLEEILAYTPDDEKIR